MISPEAIEAARRIVADPDLIGDAHMVARALLALADWGGWRPIESAPKDEPILVWACDRQYLATWEDDRYSAKPRPYWNYSKTLGVARCRREPPTMWHSLPLSPAT